MQGLNARLFALLTLSLALAGCAPSGAATAPTPTSVPSLPLTVAPTAVPPTLVPTVVPPTLAPTTAPTTAVPPTLAPTTASPTTVPPTLAPTTVATAAPTAAASIPDAEQILFLREGNLMALDLRSAQVQLLAEDVREFTATPDARRLALLRGEGPATELWVLERPTGLLWQLTRNTRAESGPSWAPDGLSLVYSSAPAARPFPLDWQGWSEWCGVAEARLLDLPASAQPLAPEAERTLAPGCEPAFGPDGKRIVFATPPTAGGELPFKGAGNTLRMVNRQGANGWNVAIADGLSPESGQLVYGPAWSPDGGQLSYQRFLGYQALVDINLVEAVSSYQRTGGPIGLGAGWMLPPRYAPTGGLVAVTEYNFSDARGLSGYAIWSTSLLRLGEPSTISMPSAELTMGATEAGRLPLAMAAAWSPDSAALAVTLPAGWQPEISLDDPRYAGQEMGELWRWSVGGAPEQKLADGVDFGSPLLWLLPAPASQR